MRRIGGFFAIFAAACGFVFCTTYDALETPTDAGGSDVVPGTDAGSDAPSARYCENDAGQIFCADFDVGVTESGWDSLSLPIGSLERDGDASTSPPLALVAIAPVTTQFEKGAKLEKTFAGTYQSLSCFFSVRRERVGSAIIAMAELAVTTDRNGYEVGAYTVTSSGLLRYVDLPDDGGDAVVTDHGAPLSFPTDEWHRVGLELTPQSAKVYVDGNVVSTHARGVVRAPLTTTFRLGIPTIDQPNSTPWRFRYDDVQCFRIP
jgi:hypothetical protein